MLPSYVEVFALALVNVCSIPPSLEPKTCYHPSVEIFINDEAGETNVYYVFKLFFPLIILHLYLMK